MKRADVLIALRSAMAASAPRHARRRVAAFALTAFQAMP